MKRVGIFVDAANIWYAQKYNGWEIDWEKVFYYLTDDRELYSAFYFTPTPPFHERDKVAGYRKFRTALIRIGFKVIDKETQEIYDKATGEVVKRKGNLDVEMVMDLLTGVQSYDEAVILGCDVDYVPVITYLTRNGKEVTLIGRKAQTHIDLMNAATRFIDLNDIRNRIERMKR
jgi:uncharacterized LabA/DUF88 family protein